MKTIKGQLLMDTSGTGSGKSLTYFLPIIDSFLRNPTAPDRVAALVVYPMFAKLTSLSSEARTSATTVLATTLLRRAAGMKGARDKLLTFTDNRQDASLQSGHFNDFIHVRCSVAPCTRPCCATTSCLLTVWPRRLSPPPA